MYTNGSLRTCQILVFLLCGTCAVVVSVAMGWTTRILKGDCILYSDPSLRILANGSLSLDADTSQWGRESECSFCTFCPVGVVIYCIVWTWFYIFLSDWGTFFTMDKSQYDSIRLRYLSTDQHLLVPSLVSNLVVFSLLLADVAIMVAGTSEFCENVETTLNPDSSAADPKECSYVGAVPWVNVEDGDMIYNYLQRAKRSAWVLLASLAAQTALTLIRLRRNTRDNPRIPLGDSSDVSESTPAPPRVRYRKHVHSSHSTFSDDSVSIETNSTNQSLEESQQLLGDTAARGLAT